MNTDYNKQALDFCDKFGVKIYAQFVRHAKYFDDDVQTRDVYEIVLKRGQLEYIFEFGQSIVNYGIPPTAYDILACVEKGGPQCFKDFCDSFGYDSDSRKAEKLWKKWIYEADNIERLFCDCIEELQEIN